MDLNQAFALMNGLLHAEDFEANDDYDIDNVVLASESIPSAGGVIIALNQVYHEDDAELKDEDTSKDPDYVSSFDEFIDSSLVFEDPQPSTSTATSVQSSNSTETTRPQSFTYTETTSAQPSTSTERTSAQPSTLTETTSAHPSTSTERTGVQRSTSTETDIAHVEAVTHEQATRGKKRPRKRQIWRRNLKKAIKAKKSM
ncbi:hypothetical protein PoB_005583700 [Plakobranchus ocellatus]|uniref:Uncharacterized protein n=1 Tax=Plakobranchus ocellatus TaxID=259542 RepID=A0AAV4CDC7_9GAST|nr:hypothetical protein PoB_005583700 [Plakobranchus ocellatus]